MWDIVLLVGLALLIAGLVKRKTTWGRAFALVGVVGIIVSLVIHGPDMAEALQRGWEAGMQD